MARQTSELTFPCCPQPSQDVEKVGTGPALVVVTPMLSGRESGWLERSRGHPCSLESHLGEFPPPCPPILGPGSRQAVAGCLWAQVLLLPAFESPLCTCPGLEGGGGSPARPGVLGAAGGPPCLGPPAIPGPQGLVCASVKVRLAERQQQKLRDVRAKRELLSAELAATQGRLMLEPGRWLAQCESPTHRPRLAGTRPHLFCPPCAPSSRLPGLTSGHCPSPVEVDPALEPESVEYLAALERATAALEQHVNLCKAHVMMVTCFDISVSTPAATPGPQEVDV